MKDDLGGIIPHWGKITVLERHVIHVSDLSINNSKSCGHEQYKIKLFGISGACKLPILN